MTNPNGMLHRLLGLRERFDPESAAQKADLLATLGRRRLASPEQISSYHDALTFSLAYPDNREILELAHQGVLGFRERRDVARHAGALRNSGMAGTTIAYRFYWPTVRWLAARWPEGLRVEWDEFEDDAPLLRLLHLIMPPAESAAIHEEDLTAREWVDRLRGREETDATFLVERFDALPVETRVKELLWDGLDLPLILAPAGDTPNLTTARLEGFAPVFIAGPRSRARPDLREQIQLPPRSSRPVSARRGAELLELARGAMISRDRDLDAIAYGNPADITLVADREPGVQFLGVGTLPAHRYLLEGTYVYLVCRNGVPIGYMQGSGICGWGEINFNIFAPWRGAEAGMLYGRSVALLHHEIGIDTFIAEPYQLGQGNEEALHSGAWWFYYKLGYRPVSAEARRVAARESKRVARDREYRTPIEVLTELADTAMMLRLGSRGQGPFRYGMVGKVGLRLSAFLARNWGSAREVGLDECGDDAARLLGGRNDPRKGMDADQREAWRRWAPLVMAMGKVSEWQRSERKALAEVIRAKGGRREREYVERMNAHERLHDALADFSRGRGA